ncbi:MAG: hypothetical protein IPG47_12600 [Thermoflexaceae bacterium]|nr:hypothetical protein [Thermoflexaceae bacterium]
MRDDPPASQHRAEASVSNGIDERATLGSHHLTRVHLFVNDDGLRKALHTLVGAAVGFELESRADGWPARGDLVIATTVDLPAERVGGFVDRGVYVVVLAAVPRSRERVRFEAAGVSAYLPMTADGHRLLDELRGIPVLPGHEQRPEARSAAC